MRNQKLSYVGAGALAMAGIMATLGMAQQGNPPWVRLQAGFPGAPQEGNAHISGELGANAVHILDRAGSPGYLKFDGEDPIFGRSELVGEQGPPGPPGPPGPMGPGSLRHFTDQQGFDFRFVGTAPVFQLY
jgi:hypothetical protein